MQALNVRLGWGVHCVKAVLGSMLHLEIKLWNVFLRLGVFVCVFLFQFPISTVTKEIPFYISRIPESS